MITVKVTAQPTLSMVDSTYTITSSVTAYDYSKDNDGWPVAQTVLEITGTTSDTGAMVKAKLRSAADAWRTKLTTWETMKTKLASLEGMEL